jgi:hypothetical protein
LGTITVLDAGSGDVVVTYPAEVVREASVKMLRHKYRTPAGLLTASIPTEGEF